MYFENHNSNKVGGVRMITYFTALRPFIGPIFLFIFFSCGPKPPVAPIVDEAETGEYTEVEYDPSGVALFKKNKRGPELPHLFVIDKYGNIRFDETGLCPPCIADDLSPLLSKLISENEDIEKDIINPKAPNWSMKTLSERLEQLDHYVGPADKKFDGERKVVVMSFYASWCRPCIREIGELHRLQYNFNYAPVQFFIVDLTEYFRNESTLSEYLEAPPVYEYLSRMGLLDIPILEDVLGQTAMDYNVINDEEHTVPKLPADLALDIQFTEPSGNNYLDAEETGTVSITITNNGRGEAYAIQPSLDLKTSIIGLSTGEFELIEKLDPSASKKLQTTIAASQNIVSETVAFEINISEHNGFDLYPPGKLTIQTKALVPPALALMDVGINDLTNYNGRIEPNEVIEATAIIQNRGQGLAKNVNISVHYGDNVFNAGEAKTSFSLGNVQPNETKEINFSFFATRKAETNLPIQIEIKEARGLYDQAVNAGLSLNEVIKKAAEVFVAGREQGMVQITDVDAISVDIEENIPKTGMKNKNGIAVVIGNRDYSGDVPDVEFAVRDAEYVREYLIKTMGYRPGNIFYNTNATFSNMKVAFNKLKNAVKKEKSDVFIYYSGHGAPDDATKQGFFVPVDADPNFIKETGYAVKDLYAMLDTLGSKSTTVVIDACFSGSSDQGMILKDISPVSIHIDKAILSRENSAVFTSSTGVQVSSWYREKKHSLFTYYFLKALQGEADSNKDNMLTLSEIKAYIDDEVPYMARRLNNRVQTPGLRSMDNSKVLVEYE